MFFLDSVSRTTKDSAFASNRIPGDYERIFNREKHRRLTQSITNTYLDIVQLCSDFRTLLREQKASSLKRIWKPLSLDTHFEDAVQRFREHKKTVEKEAVACHMIEAAESRALVEASLKLKELERKGLYAAFRLLSTGTDRTEAKIRAQLLAQLTNIDYKSKHRALRKVRHQNTGAWVLYSASYLEWLNSHSSATLCLHGIRK